MALRRLRTRRRLHRLWRREYQSTGTGPKLTAQEFRQQAGAICAKGYGQLKKIGPGTSPSFGELRLFVDRAIPIQEETLKAERALNPPDELASDWQRLLELAGQDLNESQKLRDALDDADAQKAQDAVAKLGSLQEQEIGVVQALESPGCINPKF
jgi:hypothetical protein